MPRANSTGADPQLLRRALILFFALAVLAALGAWLLWPKAPDILLDAHGALESLEQYDGKRLYGYIWDKEIRALKLTPEKVQGVLDQIVEPRFQKFRATGRTDDGVHGGGAQGSAQRIYVDSAGRELTVDATCDLTPEGGRIIFSHVIRLAWFAEYILPRLSPGENATWLMMNEGWLAGLNADEAKLKAIGIEGLFSQPPKDRLKPWAEVRASLLQTIAEETQKANRPSLGP